LLRFGQAATLLRWLETLPEEQVLAEPLLTSLYGISLIICGRPVRMVAALVAKMTVSASLGEFQGEMNMLQALLAVYQGDAPRAIQLSELALQQLPAERPFFRSLAADTLGMGYTFAWDIPAATRAFELVVEISRQSDNVMMTIMALTNLSGLSYVQGQLRSAIATCNQILEMAHQRIGSQVPMLGKTLFSLGEMLREQGDLEAALTDLLEAARLMEAFSEVGLPIVNLAIARVYLNKQDWQAAQSYLDKARQYAQATQPQLMDDRLVEAMQVRLSLARRDVGQAVQWSRDRGFVDRPPAEIFAEAARNPASYEVFQAECLMMVRLLLAQSQPERALEFVTLAQELVEKRKNQRRFIEVLILRALALHQKGQLDQALQVLAKALSLAEPEGYQRTFVDEGEPMARLLYQAAEHGIYPIYSGRLLAVLGVEDQTRPPSSQLPSAALVEPLSERELEVLRLIAEGLSNSEIAHRLYISLSTVKGHTSNIFGKLGVKNRTQAVARARSLDLLPPA
jgi:LuxR family maltose regulon positive regulatory protein